ncbi:MAG: beta-lactamase family protein [Myxococcales bacterium FL481]|nr:MAG: beta-lactamase family protein [Myxococcales bacterium FL481]
MACVRSARSSGTMSRRRASASCIRPRCNAWGGKVASFAASGSLARLARSSAKRHAATVSAHDVSARLSALLRSASGNVCPGGVALVWRAGALRFHSAFGVTATHPAVPARPVTTDTHYDLASLTKVLATTTLAARAIADGRVKLAEPLPSPWDRVSPGATLSDVLEHAAGFAAHREFFAGPDGARSAAAVLEQIAIESGVYPRRERSVYSDLGFIVLGAWLERLFDNTLEAAFRQWVSGPLGCVGDLGFRRVQPRPWGGAAPTEVYDPLLHREPPSWFAVRASSDSRPSWAQGQVHDDNAYVMGGVAGHAGLFGTAQAVLQVALAWLEPNRLDMPPSVCQGLLEASNVPNSTRRRGWDGPSRGPRSSVGDVVAPTAFGHLGFSGTSLWLDPRPGDPRVYVLLTNRVHPTRSGHGILALRRRFHELAAQL